MLTDVERLASLRTLKGCMEAQNWGRSKQALLTSGEHLMERRALDEILLNIEQRNYGDALQLMTMLTESVEERVFKAAGMT